MKTEVVFKWFIAILIALLFFAITSMFISIISIHNQEYNCQQVELLKSRVRARALEDYANLEKNGKIFHIQITPDLRRVEKKALDRTLNDFSAQRCYGLFGS